MNLSWKAFLVFTGIFVAGAVTGGTLVLRFPKLVPLGGPREGPRNVVEQFKKAHLANIEKRLDLSDLQKEQLKPIIAKSIEEIHKLRRSTLQETNQILDRMNDEIVTILTPEQKQRFEEMRNHQKDRMKALMQGGRPPGPPETGKDDAERPPMPPPAHDEPHR